MTTSVAVKNRQILDHVARNVIDSLIFQFWAKAYN